MFPGHCDVLDKPDAQPDAPGCHTGQELLAGQKLVHHLHNLGFPVVVTFNGGDKCSILIPGHDPVGRQLRILDIFPALPGTYLHGRDGNLFPVLLFLVIHDDRNLAAKHSSIEVIVGEGRFLVVGRGRGSEAERDEQDQQESLQEIHACSLPRQTPGGQSSFQMAPGPRPGRCQQHSSVSSLDVLTKETSYLHRIPPTPLVQVALSGRGNGPGIWCKLEFLNPSGSTKDRIARHILEKAWAQGKLQAGATVAEASSGSTSIAFALACSQMGLRFVAFIPDSATSERELIIKAYGGEVRRVAGGMPEVLRTARETSTAEGWFLGRQFANPDNTEAHRLHTGPEVLRQIPGGRVDAVVSGVGTGGTLRGLYESFASAGHPVSAHAAIPRDLALFGSNQECCSLRFSSDVPGVVEGLSEIYSEWCCEHLQEWEIDDSECLELTRSLWSHGFPVGPSSGLNYAAALRVASRLGSDAQVVTVFPDRMERYFSHKVFAGFRPAEP